MAVSDSDVMELTTNLLIEFASLFETTRLENFNFPFSSELRNGHAREEETIGNRVSIMDLHPKRLDL
jgi:hypothetical protein